MGLCGFGLDWEMAFWDGDVLLMIPRMIDRKCCIWREYMNFEWQKWIAVLRKDIEVAVNSEKKTLVYPRRCAMSKRIFSADRAPIPT
jgi:hypothetical protein